MDLNKQHITLPAATDIIQIEAPRLDGTLIDVYLCSDKDGKLSPKPMIIFLHGSGGDSVFAREEEHKWYFPFMFKPLRDLAEDWHVIFIEKRGVKLGDWVGFSGYDKCSKEYIEYATRDARIEDASRVIEYLIAQNLYDGSVLLLIGHSEGGHVASGVAAINHNITHLALFPFSAGHGLFEGLVNLREKLAANKISAQEFLQEYDKEVSRYRDIRKNSDSINKQHGGHAYRRWYSYCFGQPLEDLLKVKIPIFLGVGTLDGSAVGTDLVIAEFVKAGKTNLSYRNYINYDHGFFEHKGDKIENHQKDTLLDLMQWVEETIKNPV
jgi:pimeloyl-ACP methyl ester carboxylesterase